VGVLAGLLVLLAALQPWWLAPLANRSLSASAGRPVHFDSMWVTLSASLAPVVHLRGIRIENAPWADARQPLAHLSAARAAFSWRSLHERRPVIELLWLQGGEVDLERRADGLRNWRLGNPDDRGPGRYKVLAIRGENATVRFRHEALELDLLARASPTSSDGGGAGASEGGAPMSTRLEVRGAWRAHPFEISVTTSDVITFVETGRTARVRGRVSSGAAQLDIDGLLGDIVRDPIVDAHIVLRAPSLAALPGLGAVATKARAVVIEGDLRGEPGRYTLAAAKARWGSTDLAGEVGWSRGQARDLVRARLTSESTHVADLRALTGPRAAKKIEQAAAPASATARPVAVAASQAASGPVTGVVPEASAARAPPRPLDAELTFTARRLHADGMPWLQGASLAATLADGRLAVSRFDVGIGPGRAVGKATMDIRSHPPHGEIEADVSGVRVESFLPPTASKTMLSGTFQAHAALKGSGDSAAAWLASASGSVSAAVSGGTISSLLDAEMGLQGGKIVRSFLAGAEPIALRCAAARLELDRGTGRVRGLVVDSERTRTTGSGTLNLATEVLELVLTPEAKQPGLFVLDRSIRLHGPLRRPKHELVARVAPAAAPVASCQPGRS
jgi:uncharacterized protein involved in outer membrane biogenesis